MRNVVVTGASRGLGLGIARRLVDDGFRVIAIARQPSDALTAAIAAAPEALHFRPFDLAEIGGIAALVRGLHQEFGALYGLVNNAAAGTEGLLATTPDAAIDRTVRLNTVSPLVLTKHVVRSMMIAGRGGRIVSIASVVAATGYPGLSVYAATKAALTGFTRSLARELGPLDICVNAVAPGFVDTAMTSGLAAAQRAQIARRSALRRLAGIDDVANAVAYLFDDRTGNVTGTVLTVDAGNTA